MIAEYLAGGQPGFLGSAPRQVPGRRKDGGELILEAAITELRLAGDQRHFVGIVRDVTHRAAAERSLREHAEALQRYHDDREAENALASEIMRRHLQRPGLRDPQCHYWLTPASDFSGDVVAACRSPKGKLYAMLADGTGHGLAAAISLLPVLTTFYGLAERDHPLGYLVTEMNRQLLAFMPTGRFVAAGLICLSAESRVADLWLGGMPELMLIEGDGTVRANLAPPHLPLGIVDFDEDSGRVYRVQCPPDSQLVMFSDGLIEAANAAGEAFGRQRLVELLSATPASRRVEAAKGALSGHVTGTETQDDISMLVIDC